MTTCAYCRSERHAWWDCPKKPDGWKPSKKTGGVEGHASLGKEGPHPTDPSKLRKPVLKPGPVKSRNADRHRPGYFAEYQRNRRAKLKGK